jgi:hypothetical protein
MRFKSQIEKLTAKAPTVNLPAGYDRDFDRFRFDLEAVVEENFPDAEDFGFDPEHQSFSWAIENSFVMRDLAATEGRPADNMTMRKSFYVDPRKDLKAEFARVEAEYEAFQAYWTAVLRAIGPVR